MAGKFNLDEYETVESRLAKFWADHPNGRIATKLEYRDERSFIVYSEIYFDKDDINPTATGYAEEIVGASPVNRTSALENCETSSLGRSLANCNYAAQGKRPSREELEKVERYDSTPRKPIKSKESKIYTPEQIQEATVELLKIPTISSKEDATEFWNTHKELLEIPIEETTLKDELVNLATKMGWTK
jgi:hypothetical protein